MASQTITALGNAIINLIKRRTPIATANTVGMVKPDGSTINIDANGVISAGSGGGPSNNILDFKWSDHLLNDMSWLRADTFSWQDGNTYSLVYNELLTEYNNSASVTQIEEKKWVQPVLTANGTLGGSSFAVSADSAGNNRAAYMSFDGNYATKWGKNNTTKGNLTFYNPTKIKITKITQAPVADYPAEDYGTYTLYGSNDNSTWTQLCQITVEASKSAEYIPTNPDFYNYYKISQSGGHNYAGTGELSITATELVGAITYKRTPKGYKIALKTQETAIDTKYATDGIAWYYILDTANKRFKLPRTKFGFEGLRTSVGDDIEAGLPNITGSAGYTVRLISASGAFDYGSGESANQWGAGEWGEVKPFTFDASRSNSIYGSSSTVQPPATQMYLYFYVGTFTKSAEAQTAGLKAELLNGKADVSTPSIQAPYLKNTYVNGKSGYRIWSDGYCEQWGESTFKSGGSTVSLLKTMKSTEYIVTYMFVSTKTDDYGEGINVNVRTVSSFTAHGYHSNALINVTCKWLVKGYLASGQY